MSSFIGRVGKDTEITKKSLRIKETLFYDFAVQGYDLCFTYKGKQYHFLSEPDYVAYCDENYSEEYQRFPDGNTALEQFKIEGKTILELIDELEDVESI